MRDSMLVRYQWMWATVFAVAIAIASPPSRARETSAPIALTGVHVIDVASGEIRRDMTVLVEGHRITRIAATLQARLPARTQVVRAAGKYVIPGLWDMHVHSALGEQDPDWIFPLLIANGVTGIRDMGTFIPLVRVRQLRDSVLAGERVGPRMVIAGPLLNGFNTVWSEASGVPTNAEVVRAVQTLKAQGADFIKLYALMTPETYRTALDTAAKLGLPVSGQVPETIAAADAAASGQRSIEHLDKIVLGCSSLEPDLIAIKQDILKSTPMRADEGFLNQLYPTPEEIEQTLTSLDMERCDRLIAAIAARGTALVPTLALSEHYAELHPTDDPRLAFIPRPVQQAWRAMDATMTESIRDHRLLITSLDSLSRRLLLPMHRAGVPILAGTHTAAITPYVFPGYSLHEELRSMVRAGLTPLEALRTATLNPAKALGRDREAGRVVTGAFADLVVLEANPLDDIRNTKRIHGVMTNGRWLSRDALDQMLGQAARELR